MSTSVDQVRIKMADNIDQFLQSDRILCGLEKNACVDNLHCHYCIYISLFLFHVVSTEKRSAKPR